MPRAGRANKAAHELEQDAAFVRAPRQSLYASCLRAARKFVLPLSLPLMGRESRASTQAATRSCI